VSDIANVLTTLLPLQLREVKNGRGQFWCGRVKDLLATLMLGGRKVCGDHRDHLARSVGDATVAGLKPGLLLECE
jgi:hypothetical protein